MRKMHYPVGEAAKICGVTRKTISLWIRTGKIIGEKIGRTTLISAKDLERFRIKGARRSRNFVQESKIVPAVHRAVREYRRTLSILAR